MEITEKKIKFEDTAFVSLFGFNEYFLDLIEKRFQASITLRGNLAIIKGEPKAVKSIELVLGELQYLLKRNKTLERRDVESVLDLLESNNGSERKFSDENSIIYYGAKEPIKARGSKQKEYIEKVKNNDLVFAIGPAGTGKTFLAIAMALAAIKSNEVSKIILSRPAVEAGESLGFLPGDLQEKLDPYLKPLTDALYYMVLPDKLKNMYEKQMIEIIPLAYMRGRTLNNAFIILDEAQNATITQMKMFLTRLGTNSKAIVTGDITQVDLKEQYHSGLIHVQNILKKIKGIEFVYFSTKDVIRHKLVSEIIKAYEKDSRMNINTNDVDNQSEANRHYSV